MQRQGEYEALVQYESLYSIANRITTSSSSSSGGSTATAKRPPLTPAPSLRASFIRSFVSRSAASSQAQSRPGLQMRNLSTRLMHKLGRSPVVVDEQASSSKTPKIGLQCLYSAENPEVDIVAVHGLKGDLVKTWTWKGEVDGEHKEVFWLQDLLPQELEAAGIRARVLTFGYNSEPGEMFGGASTNRIYAHASNLVTELFYNRQRSRGVERPIIFVCHSLGGLVVKRALIHSNNCDFGHLEKLRSIKTSTYGILFFGTPHLGADLAYWGGLLESLIRFLTPKGVVDTNRDLINTLGKDSEILREININWLGISRHFKIFYFWEELTTLLPNGSRAPIVDEKSAVPDTLNADKFGIHGTHTEMVKFSGPDVPAWVVVSGAIIRYVEEARELVKFNWEVEHKNMENARYIDMQRSVLSNVVERQSLAITRQSPHLLQQGFNSPRLEPLRIQMGRAGSTSSFGIFPDEIDSDDEREPIRSRRPSAQREPIFLVPFQNNAVFEGRDRELETLHNLLFDPAKRSHGKTSVAVHALPGAGKTHLVRQYVFEKRRHFPGGIFWVKAFKSEFLLADYWKIATALGLKTDGPYDPRDDPELRTVELVKEWFERHDRWLLILDRSDVETDREIDKLARFVPRGGRDSSVIFTTVNSALVGAARLGSPEGLELKNMDIDAAKRMLIKYSQLENPTQKDLVHAAELIQRMGYLPLSIHSAGSFIKEKKVTIADYLDMYRRIPGLLVQKLTSFHLTLHQLQGRHREATNLLHMLAFVGPDMIPVNMIKWGIRGDPQWEKELFAKDGSDPEDFRSLNNTIGHLLRYSLIDRNAIECQENGRTWRIDMLVLHRVVQDVSLSRMNFNGKDTRPSWVRCAAGMFYKSFQFIEQRSRDREILVSDYRRYKVHGQSILEHLERITGKDSEDTEMIRGVVEQIDEAIRYLAPIYQQRLDDDTASQNSTGSGSWKPPKSIFRISSMSDTNPNTPSPQMTRRDTWLEKSSTEEDEYRVDQRLHESPTREQSPAYLPSRAATIPHGDHQHIAPPRPTAGPSTHDENYSYKRPTIPRESTFEPNPQVHIPAVPLLGNFSPTSPRSTQWSAQHHSLSSQSSQNSQSSSFLTNSHQSATWLYSHPDPGHIIPLIRTPSPLPSGPYQPPPLPAGGGEVMERLPSNTLSEPIRRSPSPREQFYPLPGPPGFRLESAAKDPTGVVPFGSKVRGGSVDLAGMGVGIAGPVKLGSVAMGRSVSAPGVGIGLGVTGLEKIEEAEGSLKDESGVVD